MVISKLYAGIFLAVFLVLTVLNLWGEIGSSSGLSIVLRSYAIVVLGASVSLLAKLIVTADATKGLRAAVSSGIIVCAVVVLWVPLLLHDCRECVKAGEKGILSAFQRTRSDGVRWSLLAKGNVGKFEWLLTQANIDPVLAIAGLELEIDKHIQTLSEANGLKPQLGNTDDTLMLLTAKGILPPGEYSTIHQLLATCRAARSTGQVSTDTASFAIKEIGIPIINQIDSHNVVPDMVQPSKAKR